MTDETRESTEQGDVERTEETRTDGDDTRNAGERTVQEQEAGGFADGGHHEGPYGGGESPGHDPDADLPGRSETH